MKRLFDFVFSLIAIVLLSPIMLLIGILVCINMGPPVIFKQKRPGYLGKLFYVYKFRTMNDKRDSNGNILSDECRLTPLGRWLRKNSLDELPQLFNVLRGDMSIVGPRPLLVEYLPYYTEREKTRHNMKPGITGLAQISGRNNLKWDERLEYDAKYVEEWSMMLDLKILFYTVIKVIKKDNVVDAPSSTMLDLNHERKKGGISF